MLASGRKAQTSNGARADDRRNARGNGAERYEVLERRGEGTLWIVYRVRERAPQNGGSRNGQNRNGSDRNGSDFNGDGNARAAGLRGTGGVGGAAPILALKALKSVANRHPRLSAALAQNARAWAALSHPNLAAPLDVGIENDTLFYTAPWLPTPSLETRLARGPIPAPEALHLLHGIAGALRYLAERDLPHGDVRPRQILFDGAGRAVLTDGGVAAAFAQSGLALADVQGEVAHYLAPERSQGEGLSAAADVYALGVCFYRMLCGRVPFDGASALAISARHRNDAPTPPSAYNARIGADMDELALRLLDKNPAQRPTAAELEAMLRPRVAQSLDSGAPDVVSAPLETEPNSDDTSAISIVPIGADAPTVVAHDAPLDLAADLPDVSAPRRRPLDEVVAETMSQEAEAKRQEIIKRARRKHKWREFSGALGALFWLFIMVGALGGGIYGAYNYWLGEIPNEVVVPLYIGQSSEQAQALLAKKGLTMKVTREAYDPTKPAGTVLAGDPAPKRKVRSQREVLVTVSAGTAPIKMVDFSKLSLDQARQIIVQHGLRLGRPIEQFHPSVPRGYICGQYPDPGEPLRRSEPITLIVSRGPQPTAIDARTGAGMEAQNEVIDPSQGASGVSDSSGVTDLSGGNTDFTPLESAQNNASNSSDASAPANNELVTRRASVRVNIPAGDGSQIVRIVVRDSNGERTVYQRRRKAGSSFSRVVSATRPDSDPAVVRIYVGDQLLREENL